MIISAKSELETQLALSLGLDRYDEIMHGDPSSEGFQRLFNGYYKIRRNEEWRRIYYSLFTQAKAKGFSFEQIVPPCMMQLGMWKHPSAQKCLPPLTLLCQFGINMFFKTLESS